MTMRKVASMALHDTWHTCLGEGAGEHKPCSAMPHGKQNAFLCVWLDVTAKEGLVLSIIL